MADIRASVACLDRQRLGQQRRECSTLLRALLLPPEPPALRARPWSRHPAALMWRNNTDALGAYMTLCVAEWTGRGYVSNYVLPYLKDGTRNDDYELAYAMAPHIDDVVMPVWWGREDVHSSHRARLLWKRPDHYSQFGWTETPRSDEEGYIWVV